ncbi:hypothetical protein HRbin41_00199 [bacterium HR41]|nr:hypothetical protein HRbin41_00199 [bacterium HR41]
MEARPRVCHSGRMKYVLMSLLARRPAHGYELHQEVEERLHGLMSSVNPGQVYATLQRLERDGLIVGADVEQSERPNKRVYELTPSGEEELRTWSQSPSPPTYFRNEFFLKLVAVGLSGIGDVGTLIGRQRRECLQALRDAEELLRSDRASDPAVALAAEALQLHLEADLEWLERCEERLAVHAPS